MNSVDKLAIMILVFMTGIIGLLAYTFVLLDMWASPVKCEKYL